MPYNFNNGYTSPNFQGTNTSGYCIQVGKMTLNGRGTVKVKPDMATINLGVETQGMNLQEVQAKNAELANSLVNTLLGLGVREKDIQTYSYTINPEYDYIEGQQVFRGYRVINNFQVTIRSIDMVGSIIDAAVKSGANLAQNIEFAVSNPRFYYNQALNLAIEDVVKKAESIERRFGYMINKTPVIIKEESPGQPIIMEKAALQAAAFTTPVQEGLIEITASLTAVFCYR